VNVYHHFDFEHCNMNLLAADTSQIKKWLCNTTYTKITENISCSCNRKYDNHYV